MKKLVLFAVIMMMAFGGTLSSFAADPVELIWYVPGQGQWPYPDAEEVYAKLNAMLEKDLGIKVTFKIPGGFGEYKQKAPLMMAASEPFDLIFTAHWCNNYYDAIEKELYAPLDELLAEHAPTISEELKDYFDGLRVNGTIYGIWSKGGAVKATNFRIWKSHREKYGWDPSTVKELKDLEPFLKDIKENEPDLIPLGTRKPPAFWNKFAMGYTGVGVLQEQGLAVKVDDPEHKLVLLLELPEYVENIKLSRSWYEKGYIAKDGMTIAPDQWRKLWNSGKVAMELHNSPDIPSVPIEEPFGEISEDYIFGEPFVEGPSITANITAISAQSKHQAEAVKLLEYMWSNKDAFNLLVMGIEGKHYQTLEDGTITVDPNSGYYTGPAPYLYGNQFNALVVSPAPANAMDVKRQANTEAFKSMTMGFAPNIEPIKSLVASNSAVTAQFDLPVQIGYVDPDTELPKYIDALKKAGIDELMEKMQAQLDAWAATK